MDEDSTINGDGNETVLLGGMKMSVQEPIVVLGIEEENEEDPEEEAGNDENENEEVRIEEINDEDPEEEARNDENKNKEVIVEEIYEDDPEEEVTVDENQNEEVIVEEIYEDDPEEEVSLGENQKEEVSIEENNEEDPEEEVRNDENRKELIIEENHEDSMDEEVKNEEDATNDARSEGKLKAISENKVRKLRKKTNIFKKKSIALRKKVKNVDTEMINITPIGDEEKKKHETGEVNNEENTKEDLQNGDTRIEAKAKEKLEANSKKEVNKKKGIKKKKDLGGKNEVVVNNRENLESSKKKTTTKDKCMGMIFMCNSKTKKDCYHYQVLGLPASKRDMVFEIYEGMKLFLYDFDLKLMYGIYEAAGPGGYNIEPKAFRSAFPAQVRFAVLEDCLPLAEEKFKKTIKDNYYSKGKFDCQLNSKQVENLCELFRVSSKGSACIQLNGSRDAEAPAFVDHGPKRPPTGRKAKLPQAEASAFVDRKSKRPRRRRKAESLRAEAPRPVDHEPKQPRRNRELKIPRAEAPRPLDHEHKQPRRDREPKIPRVEAPRDLDRKAKRRRRRRKAETRPFMEPEPKRLRQSQREETQNFSYGDRRHHGWEDERHSTLGRDHLYPEDLVASRREVYEPSLEYPPPRQPLHLPLASSLLPTERDVYGRDKLHYREVQPLDVNPRRQAEFDYRDSYINPLQQDEFSHRGSYLASRVHSSLYDSPSAAAAATTRPSEYYHLPSRGPASTFHLSAAPPPLDYQPYRPGYRYYP